MARPEDPFLRRKETIDTITRIAAAQELILYCGAGVTRDQTGLGWDGLVTELFRHAKRPRPEDQEVNSRILSLLQDSSLPAQQKASIVTEHLLPKAVTETKFFSRFLKQILYKDRGWGEGHLLRSISELSLQFALFGRTVKIVTTNYDDYLVRNLIDDANRFRASRAMSPGIRVFAQGISDPIHKVPHQDANTYIEVHYLHGVVSESLLPDTSSGDLVFSEQSYANTQTRTTQFLTSLMNERASFLAIGASLSDPPLVQALIEGGRIGAHSAALTTLPSSLSPSGNAHDAALTHELLAERARHIGVTDVLKPATFAQIAQFVEEVRVCNAFNAVASLFGEERYETIASYPVRLESWWRAWTSSGRSTSHNDHHTYLAVALKAIRTKLEEWGSPRDRDERLRLEIWMRLDPSVSRNRRSISLYANSSGPILDSECRREEPIGRSSTVASVRALVNGKPTLARLDDLGHREEASRWKTFLSVPIFYSSELHASTDPDSVSISGTVPVGVITLSSTMPSDDRDHESHACFDTGQLGNDEYGELLDLMIEAGLEIATP